MRGKAKTKAPAGGWKGITPAYAGKSPAQGEPDTCAKDHPRVCGEKEENKVQENSTKGSPPRMRGKALCSELSDSLQRITPAYAGKR